MKDKIKNIINETLKDEKELYLVDFTLDIKGKKHSVEIYIDTDLGVSLDQCSAFSKKLAKVLDDENLFGEDPYVIEVSSPGLSRPLRQLRQFKKAIDKELDVKYKHDSDTVSQIMKLIKVNNEELVFDSKNETITIKFENIEKAIYHLKW